MAPKSELPIPYSIALATKTPKSKKARILIIFKLLALLSAAVTLSTFLPTPWSFLGGHHLATVPFRSLDTEQEWKDDIWPLREQTPWDISTDFPHPRVLEYDVQEGTWLRLDVHPKTGDIVFDMVGDLYCLPSRAYTSSRKVATTAHPILLGVPHDSDPHFSPAGDKIVFRSDAGLGLENIWVMPWTGCEKMDLRPPVSNASSRLSRALQSRDADESLLAQGVKENTERKLKRLIREGRAEAQRVTNETYRWVTDARFHPSGSKVIATKWYTSGRSLGAGEGWEYPVPSSHEIRKEIKSGSGERVLGRTLPLGWTTENYGDQQIGPEQFIWWGNDSIVYSKNMVDTDSFTYSKDVHKGIYAIFSRNLTTNETQTLVDSSPGGASRPELSRDGRTLAFVRRVRDKEALVLKDLTTGTIHHVFYGLDYDLSAVSAPMGTYPSFAFTPSDDAVVIWAAGQIYFVPLTVNGYGEKVAATDSPFPIRFTAHIEKRLAETLTGGTDIVGLATQDTERVYSFKELRVDDSGDRVVFQGAGVTFVQKVGEKSVTKVPTLYGETTPYYSPSFVHSADDLILHARWSDTQFSTFEFANLSAGIAYEVTNLPLGRYFSPVVCECDGSKRQIAFIKAAGDFLTGDIVATANPGLYIADITLPSPKSGSKVPLTNLRFVPTEIATGDRINMRFLEKNKKLLVQQSSRAFIIDFGADADEITGTYPHHTLASGKMSKEIVVSPRSDKEKVIGVAFVDTYNVYFASGDDIAEGEEVWSKPTNATKGLARLSLDGGHDVTWSRDGKKLFWFLGPFLHSIEIAHLDKCSSAIKHDATNFGISCTKKLLKYQEVIVEHSTDIARLKRDAASLQASNSDSDVVVIFNATLLTMESGNPDADLIRDGVLVTRGGLVESVGSLHSTLVPIGATVINAQGGYVVPGYIDVHAHWNGFEGVFPAKSWEMEAFLAYGVTTLHNPSADNVEGFDERSRVERGQLVSPRIFTVGEIIYGAGYGTIHQDIIDQDEAYSALIRIRAEGGPSAISYKNYNLPSRASRQRLLLAAKNLSMICVPEGGMNYDWDLTYIVDGMTTVEHALPVPVLYDDVITLFASSGTGSTPTHIVNYGGAWGEQLVWATENIPNDPKLRRFIRHDILDGLAESTSRPANSYALFNTSASVAKMVHKGLKAHIGAHGEPPYGVNYHAEMFFTQRGGLSNYEVIQAATSSAAITLGMFSSLGSLSPGKLADFLVYPPNVDLLKQDITHSRDLLLVARGGRIWEASTLEELWPLKGKKQTLPPLNPDP